jgi:hypothetical protein
LRGVSLLAYRERVPVESELVRRIGIRIVHDRDAPVIFVTVADESESDYSFILPNRYARAITAAVTAEIDRHPDRFPLAHTHRVK